MAGPNDQYCPHEIRGLYKGGRLFCYCSILKHGQIKAVWTDLTNRFNIVAAKKLIRDARARGDLQGEAAGYCEGME